LRAENSHDPLRSPPIGPSNTIDALVPLTDVRVCARSRDPWRSVKPISRSAVAEPLRIGSRQQRHLFEHVAVDHRERAAVLRAAHGVEQRLALDAVDQDAEMAKVAAAHRHLAA
jgi:hypothetical protein